MATHSNIPAWRIPMDRGAWQATVYGVAKNWTQLQSMGRKESDKTLIKLGIIVLYIVEMQPN